MAWATWCIIQTIIDLIKTPASELYDPVIFYGVMVGILIYVIIILISVFIKKRVFAYYEWIQPQKDDSGNYKFE